MKFFSVKIKDFNKFKYVIFTDTRFYYFFKDFHTEMNLFSIDRRTKSRKQIRLFIRQLKTLKCLFEH